MAVAGRGRGQYGLLMLDEASLTEVALFLSARDLLQLALVCRRFGRRRDAVPTTSAEHGGSLAYEAARLQLLRRSPARRATLMPLLTGTAKCVGWLARLRTLENLEAPLEFTRVGPRVRIEEDGVLVTRSGVTCHSGHRAAIVGHHSMLAGSHFARFTLMNGATSLVGFCPASFDPSSGNGCHMNHWMLHVSVCAGIFSENHSVAACRKAVQLSGVASRAYMQPQSGLFVKGRRSFPNVVGGWKRPRGRTWPGMAPAEQGDTVGLLLDIERRSVAVYLNGQRLGSCTFPLDGVTPQQSPLVWAVDLGQQPGVFSDSIRIAADSELPPPPSLQELQNEAALSMLSNSSSESDEDDD
jgi:hypothetical protein